MTNSSTQLEFVDRPVEILSTTSLLESLWNLTMGRDDSRPNRPKAARRKGSSCS